MLFVFKTFSCFHIIFRCAYCPLPNIYCLSPFLSHNKYATGIFIHLVLLKIKHEKIQNYSRDKYCSRIEMSSVQWNDHFFILKTISAFVALNIENIYRDGHGTFLFIFGGVLANFLNRILLLKLFKFDKLF